MLVYLNIVISHLLRCKYGGLQNWSLSNSMVEVGIAPDVLHATKKADLKNYSRKNFRDENHLNAIILVHLT